MIQLGLGTFLKIASYDAEKKIKEYESHLEGGGFSYYREFFEAVDVATWKGGEIPDAKKRIEKIENLTRRKHSLDVFDAFCDLFLGKEHKFIQPPNSEIYSPTKLINIIVRPVAYIESDAGYELIYPWMRLQPILQPRMAGVGIDILMKLFGKSPINYYVVADLRKKQLYRANSTSRMASAIAASEIAFCDSFLSSKIAEAA